MAIKKTCTGCRALDGHASHFHCGLLHDIEQTSKRVNLGGSDVYVYGAKPKEECPKPTTIQQYVDLRTAAYEAAKVKQ